MRSSGDVARRERQRRGTLYASRGHFVPNCGSQYPRPLSDALLGDCVTMNSSSPLMWIGAAKLERNRAKYAGGRMALCGDRSCSLESTIAPIMSPPLPPLLLPLPAPHDCGPMYHDCSDAMTASMAFLRDTSKTFVRPVIRPITAAH
jgi:hypothetical protein